MESDSLIVHRESRENRNKRTAIWHKRNRHKSFCTSAKTRARNLGVPFDLVPEDIVFPEFCPVFGIPIYFSEGGRTDNTPSLDRLILEKGYIKGNVRIISWKANRLKQDATIDQLEALLKYMKENIE